MGSLIQSLLRYPTLRIDFGSGEYVASYEFAKPRNSQPTTYWYSM